MWRGGEKSWLETPDEVKIGRKKNHELTHKEAEMKGRQSGGEDREECGQLRPDPLFLSFRNHRGRSRQPHRRYH